MYLTRTAGIETTGRSVEFHLFAMYLTRTAGIETYSTTLKCPKAYQCILPALRELKHKEFAGGFPTLKMYLTRTAGIETLFCVGFSSGAKAMYLTRTAGIETRLTDMSDAWHRMYLTRTAGIETLERYPRGVAALQCILPALRELKLPPAGHGGLLPPNVSYPHCGN